MRNIILGLLFAAVTPGAAIADSMTLYSDVCWHRDAGDLLGYRIATLRLPDATYVLFQAAEGQWTDPSIGKASADALRHGKLVFSVMDGGKPVSFRGAITEKTVTGRFDGLYGLKGEPLTVHLSRVSASSKAAPNCR
jgi:hypothetical protein